MEYRLYKKGNKSSSWSSKSGFQSVINVINSNSSYIGVDVWYISVLKVIGNEPVEKKLFSMVNGEIIMEED